jgi:Ca2+/H+ antiporter
VRYLNHALDPVLVYLYLQLKTHAYLFVEVSQNRNDANPGDNIPDEETQTALGKWLESCAFAGAIFCTIVCSFYLIGSVDCLTEICKC